MNLRFGFSVPEQPGDATNPLVDLVASGFDVGLALAGAYYGLSQRMPVVSVSPIIGERDRRHVSGLSQLCLRRISGDRAICGNRFHQIC